MKFYIPFLISFFLFTDLSAQAKISEDFESYADGDLLTIISSEWKLWPQGTDASVTSKKASTGKNSLMLEDGKDTDVYLPFKKRFTAGSVQFSIDLFIPEGATGYFSFQGNEVPGVVWSMQCYLDDNGYFRIDEDGQSKLSNIYPQGKWFTMSIHVNFKNHLWKFYVDEQCVGSYIQEDKARQSIASLALYPIGKNERFYVDNIYLDHRGKSEEVKLKNDAAIAKVVAPNAEFGARSMSVYAGINGTEQPLECLIQNMGQKKIKNIELSIESAGDLSSQKYNLDLEVDADTLLALDRNLVYRGDLSSTISILKVNGKIDENDCNNSIPIQLKGFDLHPEKRVWIEEATGTWCGWCPRGDVHMSYLSKKYPEHFIGIAVHQNDPMEMLPWMGQAHSRNKKNGKKLNGLSSFIQGFPTAVIERTESMDPAILEMAFLESASAEPKATITHSVKWDEKSRTLEIEVTTKLKSPEENIKLVVGLTEDQVSGTGPTWSQTNYYSNNLKGTMGGYELLPGRVPDDEMVYNHVARLLLTPFEGEKLKTSDSNPRNLTIVKTFKQKIPQDWKIEHMNVVSSISIGSSEIENANKSSISEVLKN